MEEPGWKKKTEPPAELEIFVRFLGTEIDMAKLEDIKEMEYGKKSKEHIITKGKKVASQATMKK